MSTTNAVHTCTFVLSPKAGRLFCCWSTAVFVKWALEAAVGAFDDLTLA